MEFVVSGLMNCFHCSLTIRLTAGAHESIKAQILISVREIALELLFPCAFSGYDIASFLGGEKGTQLFFSWDRKRAASPFVPQIAKCLGSLVAELVGDIKEYIGDWIVRENILGTGAFDQNDIIANRVGIGCAGGWLNAIPILSWAVGGIVTAVKGTCYCCCRRELAALGLI